MLDLGWSELMVVAVIALIVVGPKELPRVLRAVTQAISKVKGLAREFQSGLDEMAREAELTDLKKSVQDVSRGNLNQALEDTVDPTGDVKKSLDEMKSTVEDNPMKGDPPRGADPTARPGESESELERKYKGIGGYFDEAPAPVNAADDAPKQAKSAG